MSSFGDALQPGNRGVPYAPVLGDIERRGRAALPLDMPELLALVRRVVTSRLTDPDAVDDIVQETLVRLLGARSRLDDRALGPYAIVVARNLVVSHWRRAASDRR